jgi:hypothetical protein
MTRYILAIAAILILAAFKTSNHKGDLSFTEKPNNVLIAVDDLNNRIGAWGGQAKTPHIDKLASQGRMFSQAYCVVPACNPSRVALFTGLRPENNGQFVNDGNFREIPAIITWEQGSHSVLPNNWNYIHYKDGSEELYNQKDDPNEYVNLVKKPVYRNLMDQLKGFIPFDTFANKNK